MTRARAEGGNRTVVGYSAGGTGGASEFDPSPSAAAAGRWRSGGRRGPRARGLKRRFWLGLAGRWRGADVASSPSPRVSPSVLCCSFMLMSSCVGLGRDRLGFGVPIAPRAAGFFRGRSVLGRYVPVCVFSGGWGPVPPGLTGAFVVNFWMAQSGVYYICLLPTRTPLPPAVSCARRVRSPGFPAGRLVRGVVRSCARGDGRRCVPWRLLGE